MTVTADAMQLDTTRGGAADLIAGGNALLQIRTKHQLMVAVQRPRDEKQFAAKLLEEAAAAGEDFFYSIPYKDHVQGCTDKRKCNCPSKPVEGPGVGLARSAARLWGNCSVDTTLEQDLDDAWLVGAWFIDFETNYTKHEVKRVSKMKILKGGRVVRAADRELDVVYQQGASKVERDVILRALPRHHIERATELAMYQARTSTVPIREQLARILRGFVQVEVGLGQLERYLGCALTEAGLATLKAEPRETCAHLVGLLAAIRGGDREADEVFEQPVPTSAAPASGAITMADVVIAPAPIVETVVVGSPVGIGTAVMGGTTATAGPLTANIVAPVSTRLSGEWGEFMGLLGVAINQGLQVAKEGPRGSGRWYLHNDECAKALGYETGVKLCDKGEVGDPAMLGRITAWIKARLA